MSQYSFYFILFLLCVDAFERFCVIFERNMVWMVVNDECVSGEGENSNHPSLIHLPKLVCCAFFLLFCYILFVWFVMEFTGFLVWLLNWQLIFHQTLWCYILNASQTKLLIKKKEGDTVQSCILLTAILLWAHTERREAVLWHWHLVDILWLCSQIHKFKVWLRDPFRLSCKIP